MTLNQVNKLIEKTELKILKLRVIFNRDLTTKNEMILSSYESILRNLENIKHTLELLN